MNKPFLYFTKFTGVLPAKILLGWDIHYMNKKVQARKAPKGTIIISNHKTLWDLPLYMMVFFWNASRFLVAEVMYDKGAFMTWLLNALGCIRVDRLSYDFSFIQQSADILKKGGNVFVFPEGRLPVGGKMSPFAPSCVMIALASGADIIPAYTEGKHPFKKSKVMIGEPFNLKDVCTSESPTREEIKACNDVLLAKILELEAELNK